MELTEIITERLERLKSDIQENMRAKGINASGRTEQSLAVEVYDSGARLVAREGERAPLETLEIGRPSGNVPSGFTAILEQWSFDKGISFTTERERRTFAYLLGKRIEREGTLRHETHEDVYSTLVNECVEDIVEIIGAKVTETIKTR